MPEAKLTLHREHNAWRLGDTTLQVFFREGRWRVDMTTARGPEMAWFARNDLGKMHFPSRREAVEYLQALLATDPLPGVTAIPRSALRSRGKGNPGFLYCGSQGDYTIIRNPQFGDWAVYGSGEHHFVQTLPQALFLLALLEHESKTQQK